MSCKKEITHTHIYIYIYLITQKCRLVTDVRYSEVLHLGLSRSGIKTFIQHLTFQLYSESIFPFTQKRCLLQFLLTECQAPVSLAPVVASLDSRFIFAVWTSNSKNWRLWSNTETRLEWRFQGVSHAISISVASFISNVMSHESGFILQRMYNCSYSRFTFQLVILWWGCNICPCGPLQRREHAVALPCL